MNAQDMTKGQTYTVTTTKGTEVTGEFVSINSKGVNLKVDGKIKAVSLNAVASVVDPTSADGMTTAELAELFDTSAKALRVTLRSLGLGVGKGRRYHLTRPQVKQVRDALAS